MRASLLSQLLHAASSATQLCDIAVHVGGPDSSYDVETVSLWLNSDDEYQLLIEASPYLLGEPRTESTPKPADPLEGLLTSELVELRAALRPWVASHSDNLSAANLLARTDELLQSRRPQGDWHV